MLLKKIKNKTLKKDFEKQHYRSEIANYRKAKS